MLPVNAGRPKKFNPEKTLETVMKVFWEKGYKNTSIIDIMTATGLHKGSIYQEFKDKKTLFMKALKVYFENTYQTQLQTINRAPSPLIGLKNALYFILDNIYQENKDHSCKGCMGFNTLMETAPHDKEIRQLLEAQYKRLEALLNKTIKKIKSRTPNASTQSTQVMTGLLSITLCGISAHAKNKIPLQQAKYLLNQQLELLGLK